MPEDQFPHMKMKIVLTGTHRIKESIYGTTLCCLGLSPSLALRLGHREQMTKSPMVTG